MKIFLLYPLKVFKILKIDILVIIYLLLSIKNESSNHNSVYFYKNLP